MGFRDEGKEEQSPLLTSSCSSDDPQKFTKRTGTIWTPMAHIITAVIGAGVLSLAWSIAHLGWIAGPSAMIVFAAITLVSNFVLSDCYRSLDPESGLVRHSSFLQAVSFYLGEKSQWICGVIYHECLFGGGVAYTITTATSISAILKSNCYHKAGHVAPCEYGGSSYILFFGLVQIVMSQIPDFHKIAWLSIEAAVMSFSYSSIGLGLGLAKVIENGDFKGSISGIPAHSTVDKLWLAFQALGNIAYAYPFTPILLENSGYLEIASIRNSNNEEGFSVCTPYYHFVLSLLRVLWICSLWEQYTWEPHDWFWVLRAILASWRIPVGHTSELRDDDGKIRTGTLWSTIAHIITAVIGSGVLSLAWSTAQLGWIAGPVSLLCFAVVTYVSASLLSDCYRSPNPVTGARNHSYTEAVRVNLGRKQTWISGLIQYASFYGTGIAYTITTGTSMGAIQRLNCYHKEGTEAHCEYRDRVYMLLFGVVQVVLSQIPDLHNMAWLSVVAAVMSFCYSSIGLGLGFAKVIENREIKGSIGGVPAETTAEKLWLVFQALGDVAFSYPYALVLLEIQDTVKSPPAENKVMKKASVAAIFITTFFYLGCGGFGYAAFGNNTPGNLLTGIGFYEPYWLIDFANFCIIVHLIGGYQLYSQPVFAFAEKWCNDKFPDSGFMNKFYAIEVPFLPAFHLNLFRLCFRTVYVVSTTGIGIIFPYFNEILGVLGALSLWPLAIHYPVEMYIKQTKIEAWTREWIALQTFNMICFIVAILALIGSVRGLVQAKLK